MEKRSCLGVQLAVVNDPSGSRHNPQARGLLLVLLQRLLFTPVAIPHTGVGVLAASMFPAERKGFGKFPEVGLS